MPNNPSDLYLAFSSRLEYFVRQVCQVIGAAMVAVVTYAVIQRYVFNSAPQWSVELSTYLGVYVGFLLIGPLIRRDDHLQVDILTRRAPQSVRKGVIWLRLAIYFIVGVAFTYYGLYYSITSGFQSVTPALEIYRYWIYIVIPISGGLIVLFTIDRMIQEFREERYVEDTELVHNVDQETTMDEVR